MTISQEFKQAVKNKDIRLIRIMLKDSLLVDKTFSKFQEMLVYLESQKVNIWAQDSLEFSIKEKSEWNIDLLNHELVNLVYSFTKERVNYCKEIIKYIYKENREFKKNSFNTWNNANNHLDGTKKKVASDNKNDLDYKTILNDIKSMNQIIERSTRKNKGHVWKFEDIEKILIYTEEISQACKNILGRRK